MAAFRCIRHSRPVLLLAFAFAVMGDPVSSVAYAIEAALRALDGRLALLLPTMAVVVGIIGLVIANYHRLLARFPGGGDAPFFTPRTSRSAKPGHRLSSSTLTFTGQRNSPLTGLMAGSLNLPISAAERSRAMP